MIYIQGRNHCCYKKRRFINLLILHRYRMMQVVKRPSAFLLSTYFNSIPYRKRWNNTERSRKRERTAKKVDHHFRDDFEKMSRKLIYAGLLQSVLTESENTNAGGFFVRKIANKVDFDCHKNLIIFLILKGQGFCTFNIYAGFRERRCRLNACG